MLKYKSVTYKIAEIVTQQYSTSFYSASSLFPKEIKKHIFNIYGFVRFADEIVDTFHDYDKKKLLENFELESFDAIKNGISTNPILHAFQDTVNTYNIPEEYIKSFLNSMKRDLNNNIYDNKNLINDYIYGSADVVGLMCLKVFCNGNDKLFDELKYYATKLGSAFQKVNFLRDLKNDIVDLKRIYFPEIVNNKFDENTKNTIITDIEKDFEIAIQGIKKLPKKSKLAVYSAYMYYITLLKKLKKTKAEKIIEKRIRVSNFKKFLLIIISYIKYKLNVI